MKKVKAKEWPKSITADSNASVAVKIYRVEAESHTFYQVANYSSGKRKLESLADEAEATKRAKTIANQIASGQTTAAAMTGTAAASYGRAIELLKPTGEQIEHAAMVYAKCYEILGGSADMIAAATEYVARNPRGMTRKLLSEVITEFRTLKSKRTRKGRPASKRYVEDLRSRLDQFSKGFPNQIISNITDTAVRDWLESLEIKGQTYRNFRTVLNTFFEYARKQKYVALNPMEEIDQVALAEGEIAIYTPKEIDDLLKAASPEFLPCLAIGAFAGLRSAEIERLEWGAVDLAAGFITVGASDAKTKSRRLIPIRDNLKAWLTPHAHLKGKVWKGDQSPHDDFYDAQADTATKAKVDWKRNALRHSYGSYRYAATNDPKLVAAEMGNSEDVIFRHYRELVRPGAAAAWFAVQPEGAGNVIPMSKAS